jgi:hypothetical protein
MDAFHALPSGMRCAESFLLGYHIGALLGHKHAATTARYAHLAAAPLRAANDAVGAKITAVMQSNLPQAAPKRSA